MAGDPTQTGAQARQSEAAFHEWYVVTGGGASAFRMTPGLTVGESESGALTLNDRATLHQWVEFVLADNGEPWATIVTRDKSLCIDGATCLRHPLGVGATVRLPNNTLYISRDISMPQLSGTVVEVVHRDIPERVQDLVGPGLEEALSAVREPEPAAADAAGDEPGDPTEPEFDEAAVDTGSDDEPSEDWSDRPLTVPEPRPRARRPRPTSRQSPVTMMTGVLALGAVTAATVAVWLFSDGKPRRLADFDPVPLEARVDAPRSQTPPADPAGGSPAQALPRPAAEAGTVADVGPAPVPSASAPASGPPPSPTADSAPSIEPAVTFQPQAEAVTAQPRVDPQPLRPVVVPPVERRPVPRVSQNADTAAPAEVEPVEPAGPDPALVAELDETALMLQAVATELGRRRDLQAANLALAEGRLTMPPDSNAYRLYNRVLAVDPGSPEATNGLQAVRQALINRALAQLAGDELDAARRTLEAAADTGADAALVTDLLAEVDYREGLIGDTSGNPSR